MELSSGSYSLITYWEVRSRDNFDVYRCVDITDSGFSTVQQTCWKALRPTGRAPERIDRVRSSRDLCGRPEESGALSVAQFCAFSEPLIVGTPYFELTLMPFENGGSVYVGENGRNLIVTSQESLSSVFFEVRVVERTSNPDSRDLESITEFLALSTDSAQCGAETIRGAEWAVCRQSDSFGTVVRYSLGRDAMYEVSSTPNSSLADEQTASMMFGSLRFIEP